MFSFSISFFARPNFPCGFAPPHFQWVELWRYAILFGSINARSFVDFHFVTTISKFTKILFEFNSHVFSIKIRKNKRNSQTDVWQRVNIGDLPKRFYLTRVQSMLNKCAKFCVNISLKMMTFFSLRTKVSWCIVAGRDLESFFKCCKYIVEK